MIEISTVNSQLRKSMGKVEWLTGMFMLVFLIVILAVQLQVRQYQTTSLYMEDALAASNLASAVIDIENFGRSGEMEIAAPDQAYDLYREAIRVNLRLDDNWEASNKELISGPVEVREYTIYNVSGEDVAVFTYGPEGSRQYLVQNGRGKISTPDQTLVESTTVYSRIGFPVKGLFQIQVNAVKEKSVDIVGSLVNSEE